MKAVNVHKKRTGFTINNTIVEIAEVTVDGKVIKTAAVEMEDPELVIKTVCELGVDQFQNINYIRALKNLVGMKYGAFKMGKEIERKFLVLGEFKHLASKNTRIIQAYLSSIHERTVRVRILGDKGYLTIKGKSNDSGTTRFEWEKEISVTEAEELMKICEPGVIDKTRFLVVVGQHTFEVDEFYGENNGLIVAEIELSYEEEFFEKPEWLGEEVTGDVKYYNSMLMKNPYSKW